MSKKLVVAITGASGSVYAKNLFDQLLKIQNQWQNVGVVMSNNAKEVWETEIGDNSYKTYPFSFYDKYNFQAPFASGSAQYDTMIVVPCSMGTLGRIAAGVSDDLITRAADVVLKERRKLILVTRETPLNLIHIKNMETVTLSGGIICPAVPSFYSLPQTIEEVAATVVNRVLDLAGFQTNSYRWGTN
ncbi:MAG: UbiX family flavin prenyltransferase [Chitinophagaceae bacterium]